MLEIEGVTAGYGDTVVLRDVTLSVPDSTVVALLGPNGAGKTTLLRTASGLIHPMQGRVLLDGQDMTGRRPYAMARRGLCHLPEGRGIFPSLTVRDNLVLQSPKGEERASIEHAVEAFPELSSRLRQQAGSLSGGEQQMLALVRAFVAKPKIVVVDEASLGLAPLVVDRIFDTLRRIVQSGTSLLLVEQYVTRALDLADSVYLLNRGQVVFSGAADELRGEDVFERYLGIEVGGVTLPGAPPVGEGVPYGTQIRRVAEDHPGEVGLVFAAEDGTERSVTWDELDRRSTQVARILAGRGLGRGDILAVCLRNSPEHLMCCFAAWKVGAVVVPVRWDLPEWERARVLATLAPKLVVDAGHADVLDESLSASTEPLDEVVSPHGWGVCSSGSTGTPKVILVKNPGVVIPGFGGVSSVVEAYGAPPEPQRVLVPAPLYHTNGFTATRNLMAGVQVVLLERFNAPRILDLIERHRVTGFIGATPMLQRLAQVPGIEDRDLSSLDWVQQGASPLPVWLGRRWCELVGPEQFFMSYGASEMHGLVTCRGDEWLEHPGTLGKAFGETEIKVLDADGKELPTGEVGAIYMRTPTGPAAFYVGDGVAAMPRTDDGFVTVGDLGWLEDGEFLFLADRRVDMIVTGAANVFPAEVESALSEHPGIADVVVVGLRDPEWGRRVHAIVQPASGGVALDAEEVIGFAKQRLAPYKVPKTVELVTSIQRNDAMKLNRAALVAERDGPDPEPGAGPA